jgi:hypothetical protein
MAGLHLCGTRPRAPLWGFRHHVGGGQPLHPIYGLLLLAADAVAREHELLVLPDAWPCAEDLFDGRGAHRRPRRSPAISQGMAVRARSRGRPDQHRWQQGRNETFKFSTGSGVRGCGPATRQALLTVTEYPGRKSPTMRAASRAGFTIALNGYPSALEHRGKDLPSPRTGGTAPGFESVH